MGVPVESSLRSPIVACVCGLGRGIARGVPCAEWHFGSVAHRVRYPPQAGRSCCKMLRHFSWFVFSILTWMGLLSDQAG